MDDKNSLHALVGRLKATGKGSFGGLGERIFSGYLRELGREVEALHEEGTDYVLSGGIRIDVKARAKVEDLSGGRFPKVSTKSKMDGIRYAYVVFWSDVVEIHHDLADLPGRTIRLSWEHSRNLAGDLEKLLKESESGEDQIARGKIRQIQSELKAWAKDALGCRARIIHRTNRKAQEAMSRRRWGPETFYEKDREDKHDLVVLLYFEGPAVYKVCAYPTKWTERIHWLKKPVGPNVAQRISFAPNELEKEFVFRDITDFKVSCAMRFALGK